MNRIRIDLHNMTVASKHTAYNTGFINLSYFIFIKYLIM